MKRKVNLVGQSTLTVSLPTKWVKEKNLKKGDEIEINEESNYLTISAESPKHNPKFAKINLDLFNKTMIKRFLHEFYRQGVEKVEMNFTKEYLTDYKNKSKIKTDKFIAELMHRFLGMEIVSQTKTQIVIESFITQEESTKINVVQNKIYFMIKDLLNEFTNAMEGDFRKFNENMYDYHDNIAKFTLYFMRLLNFSDYPETLKSKTYGLYIVIDKCIDKIRHAGERLVECKKVTPKMKIAVKEIFDMFLELFEMNKKGFNEEMLEKLMKKRYTIVHKLNSNKMADEELKVVLELKPLIDCIPDFSETYVAKNIHKWMTDE